MADLTSHTKNIRNTFGFELNESQTRCLSDWLSGNNLFLTGAAGSGKTWIAIYLSLLALMNREQSDLIIVRSLVPTRNIGFLPGGVADKAQPYMEIYEPIILEALSAFVSKNNNRDVMKTRVHFENTSFLRGKTWDNSVILVDEIQNLNVHELHTVMTRVGKNSRIIACGDFFQTDIPKSQSCHDFMETAVAQLNLFSQVNFYSDDVVRSDFVKEWCEVAEPMIFNK